MSSLVVNLSVGNKFCFMLLLFSDDSVPNGAFIVT